jgi:hypothetical protein
MALVPEKRAALEFGKICGSVGCALYFNENEIATFSANSNGIDFTTLISDDECEAFGLDDEDPEHCAPTVTHHLSWTAFARELSKGAFTHERFFDDEDETECGESCTCSDENLAI